MRTFDLLVSQKILKSSSKLKIFVSKTVLVFSVFQGVTGEPGGNRTHDPKIKSFRPILAISMT